MNIECINKLTEYVVGLLPYRDEFFIIDEINYTGSEAMHRKRFEECRFWFDYNEHPDDYDFIVSQLTNGDIIKRTRSAYNSNSEKNDDMYVLTKKGREMKGPNGIKTMNEIEDWENEKNEKRQNRKIQEKNFLDYQVKNAEWQNTLNPLIKQANESTIKANTLSEITNIYVALFTGIAGIYYLSELLQKYIPTYWCCRNLIIWTILGLCLGAGIYGYIRMHLIRQSKRKH